MGLSMAVLPASGQDAAGKHYCYTGPLSAWMVEGASPGHCTGGLPFTIVLSNGGAAISPDSFKLTGSRWKSAATLSLTNLKFADGKLTGSAAIRNSSGSVLEGVRLDISGASEEYKAKDDQGKDILKTRSQMVPTPSPLLFGDLPNGQVSPPDDLEVDGIAFKPETTRISVTGTLTGLYYLGVISLGRDGAHATALDVDSKGRLYIADRDTPNVYRGDADGKDLNAVVKLPAEAMAVAIDPQTGEIWSHAMNGHEFLQFSPGGEDKGKIAANDTFTGWPNQVRFDRSGNLYVSFDSTIHRIKNGTSAFKVSKVGSYELGDNTFFDIGPDGALWVVNSDTLYRVSPDGTGKRVAIGPDWHLGKVWGPTNVRVDSSGQIYVCEAMDINKTEFARISVFDKNGRFVRAFGRGGPTHKEEGAWEGQIQGVSAMDIAFGTDGRIYVANGESGDNVLMFQPF
jgi:hypothetical protein